MGSSEVQAVVNIQKLTENGLIRGRRSHRLLKEILGSNFDEPFRSGAIALALLR